MLRAIAHKKDRILRVADVVRQMVKDAPGLTHAGGGDDDGLPVHLVQILGFPTERISRSCSKQNGSFSRNRKSYTSLLKHSG